MNTAHLSTYLNDHLAGAIVALNLIHHLELTYADTKLAPFFAELRSDIQADRRDLERLMSRLQISPSRLRIASAWITQKISSLKLRIDDSTRGPLHLLEALEVVGLGIHGKLALWRALIAAALVSGKLQAIVDYELARRAEEQRQRLEIVRLECAKAAFAPASNEASTVAIGAA